ncbi:MAG: hypothetical protein WCW27_05135 [Patescibacteria group bacterium]|jgi:hypothetical protein
MARENAEQIFRRSVQTEEPRTEQQEHEKDTDEKLHELIVVLGAKIYENSTVKSKLLGLLRGNKQEKRSSDPKRLEHFYVRLTELQKKGRQLDDADLELIKRLHTEFKPNLADVTETSPAAVPTVPEMLSAVADTPEGRRVSEPALYRLLEKKLQDELVSLREKSTSKIFFWKQTEIRVRMQAAEMQLRLVTEEIKNRKEQQQAALFVPKEQLSGLQLTDIKKVEKNTVLEIASGLTTSSATRRDRIEAFKDLDVAQLGSTEINVQVQINDLVRQHRELNEQVMNSLTKVPDVWIAQINNNFQRYGLKREQLLQPGITLKDLKEQLMSVNQALVEHRQRLATNMRTASYALHHYYENRQGTVAIDESKRRHDYFEGVVVARGNNLKEQYSYDELREIVVNFRIQLQRVDDVSVNIIRSVNTMAEQQQKAMTPEMQKKLAAFDVKIHELQQLQRIIAEAAISKQTVAQNRSRADEALRSIQATAQEYSSQDQIDVEDVTNAIGYTMDMESAYVAEAATEDAPIITAYEQVS